MHYSQPDMSKLTLAVVLSRAVSAYPANVAVVDGAVRVTFAELGERCARLAHALQLAGIRCGDRIVSIMRDGLPFLELHLAAARIGATVVVINWRSTLQEVDSVISNHRPLMVFVSSCFSQWAIEACRDARTVIVPDESFITSGQYAEFLSAGVADDGYDRSHSEDIVAIFVGGQSNGHPKECSLNQRDILASTFATLTHIDIKPDDVIVSTHASANSISFVLALSHLCVGAKIVFSSRSPTAETLVPLILEEGCTVLLIPSGLRSELLQLVRKRCTQLRVRVVIVDAGIETQDAIRLMRDTFGAKIIRTRNRSKRGCVIEFISL